MGLWGCKFVVLWVGVSWVLWVCACVCLRVCEFLSGRAFLSDCVCVIVCLRTCGFVSFCALMCLF